LYDFRIILLIIKLIGGLAVFAHIHIQIQMENYNTIEQVLENLNKSIVTKTKTSPISGIILLIIGLLLLILPNAVSLFTNSIISSSLLISGIISTVVGIFKTFYRKNYFVATSNNQRLKSFDLNFDVVEKENLIRLCNSGKIDQIHNLKRATSNGLRLNFMTTSDLSICYSQVIGYIPFEDRPLTEPVKLSSSEAQYLKKLLSEA